jgi:hypothetical protein
MRLSQAPNYIVYVTASAAPEPIKSAAAASAILSATEAPAGICTPTDAVGAVPSSRYITAAVCACTMAWLAPAVFAAATPVRPVEVISDEMKA